MTELPYGPCELDLLRFRHDRVRLAAPFGATKHRARRARPSSSFWQVRCGRFGSSGPRTCSPSAGVLIAAVLSIARHAATSLAFRIATTAGTVALKTSARIDPEGSERWN